MRKHAARHAHANVPSVIRPQLPNDGGSQLRQLAAGCLECNGVVADHVNFTTNNFADDAANLPLDFGMGNARDANARSFNSCRLDLCRQAGFVDDGMKSSARLLLAYALDFARRRNGAPQHTHVIAYEAVSLAAPAINPQVEGPWLRAVLSQAHTRRRAAIIRAVTPVSAIMGRPI